jgi:hypothetical protein
VTNAVAFVWAAAEVLPDNPGKEEVNGVDPYFGVIAARARCADVILREVLNVVTSGDAEETSGVWGTV